MIHGHLNVKFDISLKIGYINSLKSAFAIYNIHYLQYVPTSKPFDLAWLEVLEATTLYCTRFDNR